MTMNERLEKLKHLSPEKRTLILQRLRENGVRAEQSQRIPKRSVQNVAPLSFAQQRLWFLEQLQPNSCAYILSVAVRLVGSLHITALQQSMSEIVQRHTILRTVFITENGQPIQAIASEPPPLLSIVDLRGLTNTEQAAEIQRLTAVAALQPFDLTKGPLWRGTVLQLGTAEHVLLFAMHHIVSDGWSMGILIREVAALYNAFTQGNPSPLPNLPIQYADFAVWQRQWLQGAILESHLNYWLQQLDRPCPPLALPTKRPQTAQSSQSAKQSFTLSQDLTEAIVLLSRQEGVTLFMTLLAAFQASLYGYTDTADIRVGSPIANRNRVELEDLIGFFVNTLVLRIDLSGNPSVRELLARSRQVTLDAYAHQDVPFEKLVEELQPERSLNQHPLYQVWFVLQNAPVPPLELPGLVLHPLEMDSHQARHDLLLAIWETETGLEGSFEYRTDRFEAATIERLSRYFATCLQVAVAHLDLRLNELIDTLAAIDQQQQHRRNEALHASDQQKLKLTTRKAIRSV